MDTSLSASKKILPSDILQGRWDVLYPDLWCVPQVPKVRGTCLQRLQMTVRIRIEGRRRAYLQPGCGSMLWHGWHSVGAERWLTLKTTLSQLESLLVLGIFLAMESDANQNFKVNNEGEKWKARTDTDLAYERKVNLASSSGLSESECKTKTYPHSWPDLLYVVPHSAICGSQMHYSSFLRPVCPGWPTFHYFAPRTRKFMSKYTDGNTVLSS